MTTATTRIWTFAAVLIMIVVVALGWFLGASPKLADAARFETERRSVQAQNDLARVTIAQLESDFQQLDDLREQLRELRVEFPTGADYDAAVEEFLRGMISAGLQLQNVAINEPSPTSTEAVSDDEPASAETDGAGELAAGSLLRITVNVTVGGSIESILAFIDQLQRSPRFSVVPSGTFTQGTDSEVRAMSFQLVMYAVTGDELSASESPEPEPEPEPEPTPVPTDSASPTPTPTPTP